ncbi:hypothetical protein ABEB36_011479 [Hypothenemus hampei]|uniref:Uncharacterized protein n=1 Tax=Hypothenemus hampei TaxID=57062 RepID=A0ABD1EFK0_HYPHA
MMFLSQQGQSRHGLIPSTSNPSSQNPTASAEDYENAWDPWDEYDQKILTLQQTNTTHIQIQNQPVISLNTNTKRVADQTRSIHSQPQSHDYYVPPTPQISYQHIPARVPTPPPQHQDIPIPNVPLQNSNDYVSTKTLNNPEQYEVYRIPIAPPSLPAPVQYHHIYPENRNEPFKETTHDPGDSFDKDVNVQYLQITLFNIPELQNPQTKCEATTADSDKFLNNTIEDGNNQDAGLAGAFAQLTLGVAKTAEQDAFESVLRKQAWEVGNIDYLGKDAFENIWSKITETLSSTLTSADIAVPVQPAPVETQSQTTSQEAVAKSIDTTTPTETIVTPSQPVPLPEAQTEVSLTSQITPIDTFTEQTAQPTGPEPVVSEFTQACPFVPNIQSGLVTTEKSIPTVADTATSGLTAKESSEVAIPNVESAVESPTTPTEKFSSATAAVSTLEPSEKTSPVRSESVAVTSNVDPQTTSALETPVIAPTTQLQTLPAAQSVVPTDAAVSVAESVVTPVASPEGISPIAELELTTVTSEAEVPTRTETAVPVAPTTPTETAVPVGSVTPTEAAVPVAPTTPTESAVSVAPIIPTETAVPVTPTTPTETTVPVAQTTPTETTEPVVPTTPTETAVPVAPTTPIETAVLVTESGVTSITSTKTIAPVIDPVLSPVTLTETPVTVAAVTLTESGTPISEAAAAAPAPPAEVAEVSQAKLVQATPPVIPGTPPANVPIEKSKLTTETAVPETSPPVEGGSTATPTPPPRKTDKPKKSSGKPKK